MTPDIYRIPCFFFDNATPSNSTIHQYQDSHLFLLRHTPSYTVNMSALEISNYQFEGSYFIGVVLSAILYGKFEFPTYLETLWTIQISTLASTKS
jgi:hypothetical protein